MLVVPAHGVPFVSQLLFTPIASEWGIEREHHALSPLFGEAPILTVTLCDGSFTGYDEHLHDSRTPSSNFNLHRSSLRIVRTSQFVYGNQPACMSCVTKIHQQPQRSTEKEKRRRLMHKVEDWKLKSKSKLLTCNWGERSTCWPQ